jgi:aldehyde dehydrogenase
MAYHIHEPLGVGQIIPWNFPILMAAWKLAPARRRQLRGAEARRHPDLHPDPGRPDRRPAAAGRAEHRQRPGREAGMPLATSKRIAKIAFTGSTATGRVIAQAAANNLIPATLELGGKSPNIFADIMEGRCFPRQGHRRHGAVRLQPGRSVPARAAP